MRLRTISLVAYLCLIFLLSACGSQESVSKSDSELSSETDPTLASVVEATFSGSVGDGPIIGSTITVKTVKGEILINDNVDASANYRVKVTSKKNDYPLYLISDGGTDLVTNTAPSFKLYSVASDSSIKTVNINPHSTFIVKTAEALGGVTVTNIERAKKLILNGLNFGLDTVQLPDPINVEIDESNIAIIVKASESLAEMVRRTRRILSESGIALTEDDVISIIAAEMVDGELDGKGASGADIRIALIATITSAQVLLEGISNRLMINGADAMVSMDNAIQIIMPQASAITTRQVEVNQAVIGRLLKNIGLAQKIAPNERLTQLADLLNTLTPGFSAEETVHLFPADIQTIFDDSLFGAISMSESELLSVIQTAEPENHSLIISGLPTITIAEGVNYEFTPSVSDPDGDQLIFSITNKPHWAVFDESTGSLAGMPGFEDSGTYADIVISVADGEYVASLTPFTIDVSNVNRRPVITGVPKTSVVESGVYHFIPSAEDPDNDSFTFTISNKPVWATFDPKTGALQGTPGYEHAGIYSDVLISVNDGEYSTSLSPFSINVDNTNRAPTADPVYLNIQEDVSISDYFAANDIDGDALTYSIVTPPLNGLASLVNEESGEFMYSPKRDFYGTDSFSYQVTDSSGAFATATVEITVASVNDIPVANVDYASTFEGTPVYIDVLGNDTGIGDGDLIISVTSAPRLGVTEIQNGKVLYTPDPSIAGSDKFIYKVVDKDGDEAYGSVDVTINCLSVCTYTAFLSWAPNSEPDLRGYYIYHGPESGVYSERIWVGNNTDYVYTTSTSGTHFFAVTAVNLNDIESDYSIEAYKTF